MKKIEAIMRRCNVIPVIVIDDARHAKPMAEALVRGGLTTLEVTLRTPAAIEAIQEMRSVEGATVGAGTVLNEQDLKAVAEAGVEFIITPGLTEGLAKDILAEGIPYLPGIASASDMMRGLDLGIQHFKFFPAATSGGIPALQALAGPFGDAYFCPTGGINPGNASEWLSLPSVLCVGGTWIIPVGDPDFSQIEQRARLASCLK